MLRRVSWWATRLGAAFVVASLTGVVGCRFVDPPLTPLMVTRRIEGYGLDRRWVDLDQVSPALLRAVIASEDARFFDHWGIDWDAVRAARSYNERNAGRRRRGGSTITMQCARNVFLWQGRTWVRKALEVWFTFLIEALWPKRRILEVYVNVVEWGPGIYGAEAAARHWFQVPAEKLTASQAARLAVMLPDPRRWNPAAPTAYLASRARVIARRAGQVSLAPLND